MISEKIKKYKREWQKNWRLENPQKQRNQQRKDAVLYKQRHPEKVKERVKIAVRNWRKNNPEKVKAHRKVYSAVRNGTLIKEPCFCGETKVQAHHYDYSKPLDVEWLCKDHHVLADKQMREVIHRL